MADVILYTGESSPNDVRLRVWLSTFIAVVGVAASPTVGSGQIDVDFSSTGVAASPAIGTGSVTASFSSSGVSASPAIGVGSFNADFTLSGVVAGAAVGATQINVDFTLSGVAADPQIGTGTVETIGDVIVTASGVAADPQIGTGDVVITGSGPDIIPSRGIPQHYARQFRTNTELKAFIDEQNEEDEEIVAVILTVL